MYLFICTVRGNKVLNFLYEKWVAMMVFYNKSVLRIWYATGVNSGPFVVPTLSKFSA